MGAANPPLRPPRPAVGLLRLLVGRAMAGDVGPDGACTAAKIDGPGGLRRERPGAVDVDRGSDRGDAADQIEATLAELYRLRVEQRGLHAARMWYWRQVVGFALRLRSLRAGGAQAAAGARPWGAGVEMLRQGGAHGGWSAGAADSVAQALRGLRRSPGLTVMVVLTLALGIGADTAAFSVVNSVLLHPLPYDNADRIVHVWQFLPDRGFYIGLPYERAMELRRRSETLERIEMFNRGSGALGEGEQAAEVSIAYTTTGMFDGLNLAPRLGRSFVAADAELGAEDVVMLGEGLWRLRFGASPEVIGRVLTVDGVSRVVVGVVDGSVWYLSGGVDLWLPMRTAQEASSWPTVLAWIRPGASIEQARAEMEALAFDDETYGKTVARLLLPADLVADETAALLYGTLAAVSLVLLIACVNVAHLMLTRGSSRRGEIAVRAALGAGRRRIAGELLVEGGVLALVGGALGLLLAFWGVDLLASLRPASLPIALDDIRLDGTVMAYAAGLAMLAGLIAGLAPVLDLWRWRPAEVMRRGSSTTVARGAGRIARQGLLIGEVALSLMLLIGAGLLLHALVRLQHADVGYDPEGLVAVPLSVAVGASPGEAQLADLYEQVQDVARGSGAFEGATLASNAPGHDLMLTGRLAFEATGEVDERVQAPLTFIAPGYFATLRIPILAGRDFNASDVGTAEAPVIVNRTFAERYLAGSSVIGQVLRWGQRDSSKRYRIVGVAGDAVQYDPLHPEIDLQIYRPLWSLNLRPSAVGAAPRPMRLSLLVRVAAALPSPLEPLAERLRPLGAELDVGARYALRDSLSAALDGPRFNAILFASFAAIAIGLAAVGLYGVVSHTVQRRAREMGIRMAIGARAADVRRLVLRQGMIPVIIGVILGLAGAASAGRVIAGILYLVEPRDPLVFALVPLLLVIIALAAIWRPVLRATRVDPVSVLRAE